MSRYRHISVAIPALAESQALPLIIELLERQSFNDFDVYVCVNNPEGWGRDGDADHRAAYADNQATLRWLASLKARFPLSVIDCSSEGYGWSGKRRGVGMARKTLLDAIAASHDADELVVCLDADTGFPDGYFAAVVDAFNRNPNHVAMAVPYYHPLSGDETVDRPMLRYEIYMRHYLINLLDIGSPYAFTALGSAMAFPLWAYRRTGGFTALQAGEDFYLMQKFAKTGRLLLGGDASLRSLADPGEAKQVAVAASFGPLHVEPQARPSFRVPFGTGPAIASGLQSMEESYPLFPREAYADIEATMSLFPLLYERDLETPLSPFLRRQLRTDGLWDPLRRNFHSPRLFVHACHERLDGLRILQYLRHHRATNPAVRRTAEGELSSLMDRHGLALPEGFSFAQSPVYIINNVRDQLFRLECGLRNERDTGH